MVYQPKLMELVVVVWRDANYDNEFDGDPSDYRAGLSELHDAGYFVRNEKGKVVLASCWEPETNTARRFVTIPRVLVREIKRVAFLTEEGAGGPQKEG